MDMIVLPVLSDGDVGQVRREVQRIAGDQRFGETDRGELSIVATELATNLLRHHAVEGEISVQPLDDRRGRGLEIVASDLGPGIADIAAAVRDNESSGGSLGCGLGAVRRLMDEFDIYSRSSSRSSSYEACAARPIGTVITTRKWFDRAQSPSSLEYGIDSRPMVGETANGDAAVVLPYEDKLRIAVADGMGHGPKAEHASRRAMTHVGRHRNMALEQLMREIHELLRETRGAALTLVDISPADRTLTYTGIGNVEVRLHPNGTATLAPRPGYLGSGGKPRPRVRTAPWPEGGVLIAFTDGIQKKWDLADAADLLARDSTTICRALLRNYGRTSDDATVVVIRETKT